ncbi:MAG: hypothetical protein HC897_12365, partial [Thermoanaerobaculia bacterium]|nr:hypothetical protein [Thermoanaerobaculia bacterium]
SRPRSTAGCERAIRSLPPSCPRSPSSGSRSAGRPSRSARPTSTTCSKSWATRVRGWISKPDAASCAKPWQPSSPRRSRTSSRSPSKKRCSPPTPISSCRRVCSPPRPSGSRQTEGAAQTAEAIEAEASRLLKTALLLAEAARQLGIRPDSAELWRETEKLAAETRHPQDELDRIWADGELIHELEDLLLRRRVVAAVIEKAKVEDVPTSFEALARRRKARVA